MLSPEFYEPLSTTTKLRDRNLLTPSATRTVLVESAFSHLSRHLENPVSVVSVPTISSFKSALKTHCFELSLGA